MLIEGYCLDVFAYYDKSNIKADVMSLSSVAVSGGVGAGISASDVVLATCILLKVVILSVTSD